MMMCGKSQSTYSNIEQYNLFGGMMKPPPDPSNVSRSDMDNGNSMMMPPVIDIDENE